MCTDLPAPENGQIVFSTGVASMYAFDTVATYICDLGFGIVGGTILRTCSGDGLTPNGTWTGTAASCSGMHSI